MKVERQSDFGQYAQGTTNCIFAKSIVKFGRMRLAPTAIATLLAMNAQVTVANDVTPADVIKADTAQCSIAALQPFAPANAKLTKAEIVAAGTTKVDPGVVVMPVPLPTSVPEYCLVEGNIPTPQNDEGVGFQVSLPSVWNEKFVYTSQGAFVGGFYPDTAVLAKGYVNATSDAGHRGDLLDTSFARGQPGKLVDYAYRGNYLSAQAAKGIIKGYYKKPAQRAVAEGCSGGGRSTLKFAQLYPTVFDGYIVAAPAMDWSDLFLSMWVSAKAAFKSPASFIPPAKFEVLSKAVFKACDGLDGAVDGVLQDPRACHFDTKALLCKGKDKPDCFTQEQLTTLEAFTRPTRNKFGDVIARGWPLTGEEGHNWGKWLSAFSGSERAPLDADGKPNPGMRQAGSTFFAVGLPRDFIFTEYYDKPYDWRNFDPDLELGRLAEDAGLISAMDTNLMPMAAHGGKMLFYHGWADMPLSPQNSVDYVEAVQKRYGKEKTDEFLRLFMVPGMPHCIGGSVATGKFDALGTLEEWLSSGRAPDQIQAAHFDEGSSKVTRTRPLCPHPMMAKYKGAGGDASKFDVNAASSWYCAAP